MSSKYFSSPFMPTFLLPSASAAALFKHSLTSHSLYKIHLWISLYCITKVFVALSSKRFHSVAHKKEDIKVFTAEFAAFCLIIFHVRGDNTNVRFTDICRKCWSDVLKARERLSVNTRIEHQNFVGLVQFL